MNPRFLNSYYPAPLADKPDEAERSFADIPVRPLEGGEVKTNNTSPSPELFELGPATRRFFNTAILPMWIYDEATLRFLDVNDAALQCYGFSREEFLSMTVSQIRHPDEMSEVTLSHQEGYMQLRATGRYFTKSGECIEVESVGQEFLFMGRRTRLIFSIDVTDRNRAVAALRRRARNLRS
jgi:PAS domain S-box-containing protein